MRKSSLRVNCIDICQHTYDELVLLNTLITSIHQACLNLELNSVYYENSKNYIQKLSEERNRYISLSNLAIERLGKLELLNTKLENEVTLR